MKVMTFETVYATLPSDGWLSESEAELLWMSCVGCKLGVEVGCYRGRSSVLLASRLDHLTCVDPFMGFCDGDLDGKKTLADFTANTQGRKDLCPIILIISRIEDVQQLPQADIVYLDGDHTYNGTCNQINAALKCDPKVIAVHDVNDKGEGSHIKRACIELLGQWNYRVERLAVWNMI